MNTIKTSDLANGTISKFIGNDSNGNTVQQSATPGVSVLGKFLNCDINTNSPVNLQLNTGTSNYFITDIIIGHASSTPSNAAGIAFYSGANTTGLQIYASSDQCLSGDLLRLMTSTGYFFSIRDLFTQYVIPNFVNSFYPSPAFMIHGFQDTISYQVALPEGVPLTIDVYVLGQKLS